MLQALPPNGGRANPSSTPNLLGMTETGGPHTMVEVPETRAAGTPGSFGIPLPGLVQHRIVDAAASRRRRGRRARSRCAARS